jgi:hypothetical protein
MFDTPSLGSKEQFQGQLDHPRAIALAGDKPQRLVAQKITRAGGIISAWEPSAV